MTGGAGGKPGTVLIWVQHLLGIGHLMRAAMLARAFAGAGLETHVASGGLPVPDLDLGGAILHQLPPVASADAAFSGLVDAAGATLSDTARDARRDVLLSLFDQVGPAAVMIEHFPFGRRAFRFELLPLLERAAQAGCLRIGSVRDILVARSDARHREAAGIAIQTMDHVLVHGDPDVAAFGETFPHAAELGERLAYSGYLGGEIPAPVTRVEELVVSAGGGRVGQAIEQVAIDAAGASGGIRWRVLVGARRADADIVEMKARAPANLTVERARPDFRDLLARARASVSQCGYNTAMDILTSRVPAVVVPFAAEGETEQTHRAGRLAARGLVVHLPETALTPDALLSAIHGAETLPGRDQPAIRLDGVAETVRLVRGWLEARA